MKAVRIKSFGGSEVLEINEVDTPIPQNGQVLVEVFAASVNPFDVSFTAGSMKDKVQLPFPIALGGDFSGVVRGVGEGVTSFKSGDEVYGTAHILGGGSGSFAQNLVANADGVSLKPKSASFEEAAALVLVGVSAVQGLEENIKLENEQKIVIHGGAGGIGHIAIQLAKKIGAHVSTTVSTEDIDFVKSLGATGVIDYKNQEFYKLLKEYDAVFDTVGGETMERSLEILRKGGVLNSMKGKPSDELVNKFGVVAIAQVTKVNTDRLVRLARYVDEGTIKVTIDKTFAFDLIKDAYETVKAHHRGKVVVKVKP